MNITVCVKQIPGPDIPARLDPMTRTLDRPAGLVLDDADSYGLEIALRLVEAHGGSLTAVSMARDGETSGLRSALAMGATAAIVVSDEALIASDALSTAKVLAAAIRLTKPDLIVCATESSDGYSGLVSVQIAALLDYPSLNFVKHIEFDGDALVSQCQTEDGYDVVRCGLPAVLAVTAGVVEPRYPTLKGTIAARDKPIRQVSLDELGISREAVGRSGARQHVTRLERAEARGPGDLFVDDGTAETRILDYLTNLKVL